MAKSRRSKKQGGSDGPDLFGESRARLRHRLILARTLAEESQKMSLRGERHDRAFEILNRWADLDSQGHLRKKKETSIDGEFLKEVFCDALGYTLSTASPDAYTLTRQFSIPGIGSVDGAIGTFGPDGPASPVAVIELKGANADLDHDRSNGRTSIQQCWDYLNALPDCPWGIVSNFETIRLYHRDKTQWAYEEFTLQDMRDPNLFREFYCLFERDGLLTSAFSQPPRAVRLLEESDSQRLEVGDKLYAAYSRHRNALIRYLQGTRDKSRDTAIRIAQKILDRIIFIAFCEQRGLLPDKCLETAYATLPPFSKVTNPRWRNFLDLFHAIDKRHESLELKAGYNGGLFRHDPEVDDLQLDDEWTATFTQIATYDFKDEVNVDVLGHLFERSIGELESLRTNGLFEETDPNAADVAAPGKMQKSAERKRSGVYYTPPDFTRFLIRKTLAELIQQRQAALRLAHQFKPEDLLTDTPAPALAAHWEECWNDLRALKIIDPACGSGAFLIRAYDVLEEEYSRIAVQRRFHEGPIADGLIDLIPHLILTDNLHGVDLSEQAVEIAQLALWIRSAHRGKTLADLSHNILWKNSLVEDPVVHPKAIDWEAAFPAVFGREAKGFDCVVGNPPWERLKLQEREFFSHTAPEIAEAVSAAQRRKLIIALEMKNPTLHDDYVAGKKAAEQSLDYARNSGKFPLTGQGDINTYMLFAELARRIVAPHGRVGLLVPSGVATDNTTKEYFADIMSSQALIGLYDFENRLKVFPDVDGRFKFSALIFGGAETRNAQADFVFFAHRMEDLRDKDRHITLTAKDIALLNPNTRTCPIFRTKRDAELTKGIYRRVPILIDESRKAGGNPWGIKYRTMFHQTNDAELFKSPEELQKLGCRLVGNRWIGESRIFLPLYEAKMVQAYDHRAAGVLIKEGNWVRQGQTEPTSLVSHQNPEFVVQPRWWVEEGEVSKGLSQDHVQGFLGIKDITSPTNQRTMIASYLPWSGVTNHLPLILTGRSAKVEACLLANLNSLVLDYVVRQKIGGVTLNFFIINQLPLFPPEKYAEKCPWEKCRSLESWISDRVLKLTCTADDMRPLAEAAGFAEGVHKWQTGERAELLAELDAAFFLLYGVSREDMEYILSTFRSLDTGDETLPGMDSQQTLILTAFDQFLSKSGR